MRYMKIRATILAGLIVLSLSGCGYDGHYRYPCQDPKNWGKKECNVPKCEATGQCTKDLIGQKAWDAYEESKGNG